MGVALPYLGFDRYTGTVRGHWLGLLYLNLVTLLWGTTFVVVKGAVDVLSPSALVLGRFLIASLVMLPMARHLSRPMVWAGLELGFWLAAGYATQAIGLQYTEASRSAFITALNVILVPVILGLIGHRLALPIWVSAALAIVGVGLLSYDGSPPNIGDLWTLGTAITYALYIVRLEVFLQRFSVMGLTVAQVFFTTLWAALWFGLDAPATNWSTFPWVAIVYLGLAATALTTWLQTLGQRYVSAPEAAIVYTLEPVWASLFAYIVLSERMGPQGLVGAALVLVATLVSQLPMLLSARNKSNSA